MQGKYAGGNIQHHKYHNSVQIQTSQVMANSVKSYNLNQDKTLENNESNFIGMKKVKLNPNIKWQVINPCYKLLESINI